MKTKRGMLLILSIIICIFLIGITDGGKTSGVKCAPSLTNCFGKCVNLASDAENCGTCGMACPDGFICNKKRCVCPPGKTACNGVCIDLMSDPENCAACGLTCTGGKVCSGGTCVCPTGLTDCSGTCINTSIDPENCGACGKACSDVANGVAGCSEGKCTVGSCNAGFGDCDGSSANGCEKNIGTDPTNCGSCGNECLAPYNGAPTCSAGACGVTCDTSYTKCGLECVDLKSDSANCGTCGHVCSGEKYCDSGECVCQEGQTDCDGTCKECCSPDNTVITDICEGASMCCAGQETQFLDTTSNCGACGNTCGEGQICGFEIDAYGPAIGCGALPTCCVSCHNLWGGEDLCCEPGYYCNPDTSSSNVCLPIN